MLDYHICGKYKITRTVYENGGKCMKNANNSALNNLLNSVGNSAAEITRNLSLFGDGNMEKGIQNLYEAGKQSGMIKGKQIGMIKGSTITAVVFGIGISTYILIKNSIKDNHIKNVISSTNHSKVCASNVTTTDDSPVNTAEFIEPQTKNTV